MYTPIRRGHKPTPSQESNTLSEASCTTTLSVESTSGHLSPTYHEDEENRLDDFKDEYLSASRERLPSEPALVTSSDDNSNIKCSVAPPISPRISRLTPHHINNNNIDNKQKCDSEQNDSALPSDVTFIDDSFSDRRSTLSSSVDETGSNYMNRSLRNSCDTVIPVNKTHSAPLNSGINTTYDGKGGSSNSDYGSYCATPTDRDGGRQPKRSNGPTSGRPADNNGRVDQPDNRIMLGGDMNQNAPLLSDMEDDNLSAKDDNGSDRGRPYKVNIPSASGSISSGLNSSGSGVKVPHEPLKTLLSALFLGSGFIATTTSLAITHEHVPDIDPLPDIILDNVTYTEWGLDVSEYLIMISTMTAFLVVMLHSHRLIILRRIWFLLGCLYYYRAITMFITVLPKADPKYTCHPKLENTTALPGLVIAKRVLTLVSGMGLSINGKHIFCGDYIFSGHTMVLTMGYLVIKEYSPRRFFMLHWMSFFTSVIGIVMLLIARGHYSIDCLIAYYITTRMWYIYHTMAHNNTLKSRGRHNFLDGMWWWLIFRFFERNIAAPLPHRYSFPLPRPIKRLLRRVWQNIHQRCTSQRQHNDVEGGRRISAASSGTR